MQEALAGTGAQDQDRFLGTACCAAGLCQWDLGCPFLHGCRSADWGLLDER